MSDIIIRWQPGDESKIIKCSICGKNYQLRHMWIGPDAQCIICFERYQGYPRDKLNIKKTYNFIKKYLIDHYHIHDKYNLLEKYQIGCQNADKLDEIVYGYGKLIPENIFNEQHETPPVDLKDACISRSDTTLSRADPTPNVCPPPSFGDDGHSGTSIDTEIAALVAEMNRVGIHTACSCQGHDGGEAYVSIRLGDGTTYEHRKDVFGPGQDELILKWKRKK